MKFNLLKTKKKTEKNKEKSRGRSMVEMLGVLAIIGVLSIGGIQGYTMAMRKYKANEILNELQKYAVSFYTSAHQKLLNDEVYVNEYGMWTKKGNEYMSDTQLYDDSSEKGAVVPEIAWFNIRGIKSTNSGDIVLFAVEIQNKELCETIINITGETAPGGAGEQCGFYLGSSGYTHGFYLSFLMN